MDYYDEKRNFTLTATGDLFITRKLSPYKEPSYKKMWDIIRGSDIRFTNLEMLIHEFAGYPVAESGGTYTQVDPMLLDELEWAGFNLLSRANNHSLDYGVGGLRRTSELLDQRGFCHAGVGEHLADARSPRFLDLAQGRVALISAASSFANHGRAGEQRSDMMGRPGLNPVRYTTKVVVDEESLEQLHSISKLTGYEDIKREMVQSGWRKPEADGELEFSGTKFSVGDDPGIYTVANEGDVAGNLKWVRDAADQADFVVYTLHAHEGDMQDRWKPATFHKPFARQTIDAGADIFIGHGPHFMRGIEIYKKKPIFYSLGNFVFQNETVRKLPQDSYDRFGLDKDATPAQYYNKRSEGDTRGFPANRKFWESVLPWCRYEDGMLVELILYPVTLGFSKQRTVRGRPMLATGELAEEIINQMTELSKPFGTTITFENGVGVVKL